MNERGLEVKVGLLVVVCLALLGGFVVALGDFAAGEEATLWLESETSADVKPGAPVKIAGVTSGKVRGVAFQPPRVEEGTGRVLRVRIQLGITRDQLPQVHQDAQYFITTLGVLGEKYVEIDPGSPTSPAVADGATVVGDVPLKLEEMASRANRLLASLTRLVEANEKHIGSLIEGADATVQSVRKTAERLDTFVGANEAKFQEAVDKVVAIEAEALALLESANRGLGDGTVIKETLEEVRDVAKHADALVLKTTGHVDPVVADLRRTVQRYEDLADRGIEAIDMLSVKVDGVVSDTQAALADVKTVTGRLAKGEGSVGALLADDEMYDDIREMVKDLKRHPWKFIWKE